MDVDWKKLFRQIGTLAIVLGGHVLLVMLIASDRTTDRHKQSSTLSTRTVLVLLKEDQRRELPPPKQIPQRATKKRAPRDKPSQAATNTAPPSVTPEAPVGIPQIDWRRQAEITTSAMASRLVKEQQRKCEEAKRTRAVRPIGCKKDSYEAEWKPEPGRFGMSGGIPYVRLGKRCAVGLGFFDCGVGKLPEADGTLFEDMDDPDRPRSSVPDIGVGAAAADLPAPIVVRE